MNKEQEIKTENLKGIYLLYGEEEYLLNNMQKKLIKAFGEKVKGINFIQIDDTNISSLIDNIETPAFGYPKKLLIAKYTGIFKKDSKKKTNTNNAVSEKIAEYILQNIKQINESVVLIFIEKEVEKNTLYKNIEKLGNIYEFKELKVNEIGARLKSICKAYNVNIEDYNMKYFIESCGTDMQELINEIRKLIEYAGNGGTIQKDDIDNLCIKKIDSVIFDLTDNLGKKDIKKAMEVLKNLKYQKEPVQKILITLYNHFKKIYLVKLSQKSNKDALSVLNLKPNQTFLINKYKNQASYFTEKDIKDILQELINLDYKYKKGEIDIEIGLDTILCRYF